ncbi:MAG: PorV/PorQ family protein [Bacteroidales bacterium]|nr:PorV/PorQ family protein [Bacteroidales bacterium]
MNYGYASYATQLKNGMFGAGIHYLNYGKFTAADETGKKTGEFTASDYSLNLFYSRKIDSLLTIGITLKPIYSHLETYSSVALAADAGITYHNPEKLFTASFALRNIGRQITTYYKNGEHEPLPFDVSLGISQALRHAPFKFYIIADHLEKWDLTYKTKEGIKEEVDPFTGEIKKEK